MEPVAGVALDWTVINYQWVRGGEVSATADSFKSLECRVSFEYSTSFRLEI